MTTAPKKVSTTKKAAAKAAPKTPTINAETATRAAVIKRVLAEPKPKRATKKTTTTAAAKKTAPAKKVVTLPPVPEKLVQVQAELEDIVIDEPALEAEAPVEIDAALTKVINPDNGLDPLFDEVDEVDTEEEEVEEADSISAADLAIKDLAELDEIESESFQELLSLIEYKTNGLAFEDYDFDEIIENLDLHDVSGSYATLEAYRGPFVIAAEKAHKRNPSAEFYNFANPPLFTRRIELRARIAELESIEDPEIGDEIDLARAKGNLDSLTSLIVRLNFGMTRNYVRQFTSNTSKEDSADFQAAATLGLMVAIDSFDPSRGKFGSWAYKPIQRAVLKSVREADFKNLNEGDFEKRPKVLKAFRELVEERGEDEIAPTHFEVAERAGVHHALAKRVLSAPHLDSIHARVGDEGSSELGDLIPDNGAAFEEQVMSAMDVSALMEYGMKELDPREHFVLVRVFGLDGEDPDALSEIGEWLGLSREAARQIRGKALAKLLHPITLRKLVRGGRD